MDLYDGGKVTLESTPKSVGELLGISSQGFKISFMRAAKNNGDDVFFGYSSDVTGDTASGFIEASEAVSFDHPRPDAQVTYLTGTTGDKVFVTVIGEGF